MNQVYCKECEICFNDETLKNCRNCNDGNLIQIDSNFLLCPVCGCKDMYVKKNFNQAFLDKEIDVLFTGLGKKNNQYVGRTPFLQPVHVFSSGDLVGKILKIKIERLTSYSFHGRILNS